MWCFNLAHENTPLTLSEGIVFRRQNLTSRQILTSKDDPRPERINKKHNGRRPIT